MKKIVLSVIVALIAITANAQVYVGGTFGVGSDKVETEGTEVKNTTFKILPEVGYELNEDWSVGTVVGYEYNKSGDVKTNTFTIAPYARYFFLNSDVVRLFADGGFGFSTSKTKGNDAFIIRKSKFPQNPKRSVRFSGKRTKRSVQKRKARNTQKAETKVL